LKRRDFGANSSISCRGWEPLPPQSGLSKEAALDSLADLVSDHLDCEMLNGILAGTI